MNRPRDAFPTLRHLRGFLFVSGGMSVHAAARGMHISQPALTLALAGLDRRYGARLFERRGTGRAPTASGSLLDQRARRCLAHLRQAASRVAGRDEATVERVVQRWRGAWIERVIALG
jgi:DNA-binding transcriptional LysR family regulator